MRWRNELGDEPVDHASMRAETNRVGMPTQDPVFGKSGPLLELWRKAAAAQVNDAFKPRAKL
jgi:hypothetical protein